MPDTTTPLPLAVELARQMVDDYISDQHEQSVAAIIDARVRPLVEALRAVSMHSSTFRINDATARQHIVSDETMRKVDAALRAAGAE